jgi:hypothetical protein
MDTKNKEEITEVLSKIENLRAAQIIYQNYSATYNYIIEKYFNPKIEEFAKQKGLKYHYEKSEELYVRFHLTNSNWQGKCWIGFTFEANRFQYGICNNPNIYKLSDGNRKIIHEYLKKLNIVSRKESDWWPIYSHITNLSIEVWENDIIKSDNFLNDCKEKIEKLLTAMKGIDM